VILEIAYKKHKDWLRICKSFNCSADDCDDIVSELYLKIDDLTKKGKDLRYGDNDINYFYCYKIIFHSCLRLKQHNKKRKDLIVTSDSEKFDLSEALARYGKKSTIDEDQLFDKLEDFTNEYREKLTWYDITIFELLSGGKKISELQRETNISYVSLRNTYLKVKSFIKQQYEKFDWTRGSSRKDN
jgi:hypothetical protein